MIGALVLLLCVAMSGVGVYMHTGSLWLGIATTAAVYALMPWRK